MKQIFNYFITLSASLLLATSALAQETDETPPNYSVEILARANKSDVFIRWAPAAKETWLMGNAEGYMLERRKADGKGWQLLANVKPYTLEEWKSNTDTTDVNNAIAAQCLLGKRSTDISGNATFTQYLRAAQETDNRYAYALMAAEFSQEAAQGLGLFYKDADLKMGELVEYRVYVKHIDLPFSGDTARMRVYTNKTYAPKKVVSVTVEPRDGKIELYWNRPLNSSHFSGYYIEKSIDKGKNFKRLNLRPYVKSMQDGDEVNNNYSFIDTNVVNYKPYQYRVLGVTPFGEVGLPSTVLKTEGIDLTAPIPPSRIYVNELDEPGKFEITWEATTNAPDHAGFHVGKSASAVGPFNKITQKPLSKKARSFVDEEPSPYSSIYYVVFSVDDKENENMSSVAVGIKSDSLPPVKPVGLTGSSDSLGVVMLAWEMNTESDLQGYRVYRANRADHEFIQLTSSAIPGNFYFDTISTETLTKDIFYKVVALDHHYNTSPYSEPVLVRKPDYIPPSAPTITDYRMSQSQVSLNWKPSASNDAVYQVIYRKKEDNGWIIIKEFENNTDTAYVDTSVAYGNFYTYTLVAIDDAGLYSKRAHPVKVKVADSGVRPGVTAINGKFGKKCKCFEITWEFSTDKKHHFVLFRDENKTGLQALTTLPKDSRTYTDTDVYSYENGYEYRVKVIYADGGESRMSPPVSFVGK